MGLNCTLKDLLDLVELFHERKTEKWDNLLLIDGKERSGKSTLAVLLGFLYQNLNKKVLTVDNIHFDIVKLMNFATNNKEEVIIWDEAAFGGLSSQWHNKFQKILNVMLMTCGKYNHFFIFIIPRIHKINSYCVDRCEGLIHVYSPDKIKRGFYQGFNDLQTYWIYNNYRQSFTYGKSYSFHGKWTEKNMDKLIDWEKYEEMKDNAIKKYLDEGKKVTKDDIKLKKLQKIVANTFSTKEVMEKMGVSQKTVYNWRGIKDSPVLGTVKE